MAYHSENGTVHHIYTNCQVGNNIESKNKKSGTGNKPLCEVCKKMKEEKK